ncbi:MAG: hypothetical protein M1816_005427 [Peltula sp. TS41687]|nr:MAG: hypothetical protein M1816_005427 [Peltula sp. TS41687]
MASIMSQQRINNGSSTMVMEMQSRSEHHSQVSISDGHPIETQKVDSQDGGRGTATTIPNNGTVEAGNEPNDLGEAPAVEPPITAVPALQKWNSSRANIYKLLATFFSFVLMGANDAAYGPLIPYLETYYHISFTVVSLVFLSPLAGYAFAAVINNKIHLDLGQRGVSIIGPGCHLVAYIVLSVHPPYPVLVVIFILAGFGNGLMDAAWNAWVGNMADANEILGFLHGFYGLGATLSPLIATSMITKAGLPWYAFFYIMTGAAALELLVLLSAFWNETGRKFKEEHPRTSTGKEGGRIREALSSRVTWTIALFLLGYVGIEVALGGWIVTFMMRVRKVAPFPSGMTAVGFWLGITVGRVVLGFITGKIGEKLAITIYYGFCIVLELCFWLIPQYIVSAIAVAFLGFFLGPFFPAAIVAATKLLPVHLHVSAIGFAAAFGGGGAAILPFAVGAIAQAKGVQVLQPFILALLVVTLALWLSLPRIRKGEGHRS